MILTDREIKNSLASGQISIDPAPPPDAFNSTTVDLTLDRTLRIFRSTAPGLSVSIDPGMPGYRAQALITGVTDPLTIPEDGWDLRPGRSFLDGRASGSN